jgi:hypothetical protein
MYCDDMLPCHSGGLPLRKISSQEHTQFPKVWSPHVLESRSPKMFKDKDNIELIRKMYCLMTLGVQSSRRYIYFALEISRTLNFRSGLSSFIAYFEVFKRRQNRNVEPVKYIILFV